MCSLVLILTRRMAILALAAVFCVVGPLSADELPGEQNVRVITFNIHHGEGTDGRVDLGRIADLIRREGADLVGLQEVDRGVARTEKRDLAGELASLTGMAFYFSNNFHFQGGEYGNAILSRYPILERDNTHFRMLREGEQRGILQVVVSVNGLKLAFLTTHLDFRPQPEERLSNVEEIHELLARHEPLPVIVCGDFNDLPGSLTHLKMKERLVDAWEAAGQGDGFTFSSAKPAKRIDFVWFSAGGGLTARSARVIPSPASDHMALVVEFGLRGMKDLKDSKELQGLQKF